MNYEQLSDNDERHDVKTLDSPLSPNLGSLNSPVFGPLDSAEGFVQWSTEIMILTKLGLPLSLSDVSRTAQNVIALSMLGHLGTDYLSGVALASVWTSSTFCLALGVFSPLEMFTSQSLGAKQYHLMFAWLQIGLIMLTLIGVIVACLWWFTPQFLSLLGFSHRSQDISRTYSRYMIPGLFADLIYFGSRTYITVQQIVLPDLVVDFLNVFLLLVLNYTLIFGINGVGGLGFVGSPIARSLASTFRMISYTLYCFWFQRYHQTLHTENSFLNFNMITYERFCKMFQEALPNIISQIAETWQYNIVMIMAGKIGEDVAATMGLLETVFFIFFSVASGLGEACGFRVGFFLGADRPSDARKSCYISICCTLILAIFLGILSVVLWDYVAQALTKDPNIQNQVIETRYEMGIMIPALLLFLPVVNALIKQGRIGFIAITIPVCTWIICLPLAWYFGYHRKMNSVGFWIGIGIGYWLALVIMTIGLIRSDWEKLAEDAQRRAEKLPEIDSNE